MMVLPTRLSRLSRSRPRSDRSPRSSTFGSFQGRRLGLDSAARNDHTHGNPTHDAAAHSAISRSALAAPTADLSMGGFKLTSLGTPTRVTDATTKDYVDNLSAGLSWKDAVRVAVHGQRRYFGLAAIDGMTLVPTDRVLLKNQTSGQFNGIYWPTAGAWIRAPDADTAAEILQVQRCSWMEGTQADTAWAITTNAPITLGTTVLTFAQFGAGTSYTAGNGLTSDRR